MISCMFGFCCFSLATSTCWRAESRKSSGNRRRQMRWQSIQALLPLTLSPQVRCRNIVSSHRKGIPRNPGMGANIDQDEGLKKVDPTRGKPYRTVRLDPISSGPPRVAPGALHAHSFMHV